MRKYFIAFIPILLTCIHINAQGVWLHNKYQEIDFRRKLKTELSLVEKIKHDTIYVIWLNAAVHNPDRPSFHLLWFHQGDSIIAYVIKTVHKKCYWVQDTVPALPLNNLQHRECFNKGGWDLLHVYFHKTLVKSAIIDQECLLNSFAENELEKRLQHDISLFKKQIKGWTIHFHETDIDLQLSQ